MDRNQRSAQILIKQLRILKDEKQNMHDVVEDYVKKIELDVESCINGHSEHEDFATLSMRIQQATSFVYSRSLDFSGNKESVDHSTKLKRLMRSGAQSDVEFITGFTEEKDKDAKLSESYHAKFAVIEEAIYSLKQDKEKITVNNDRVEKALKDLYFQQSLLIKKIDNVSDSQFSTKESMQSTANKNTDEIKRCLCNLKILEENMTNDTLRLANFEKEIHAVSKSLKEISVNLKNVEVVCNEAEKFKLNFKVKLECLESLTSCSAEKVKKIEGNFENLSSKCMEMTTKSDTSANKRFEEFNGMICQLLAKRLTSLEEFRDIFNKNLADRRKILMQIIESKVMEVLVTRNDAYYSPTVGFSAWTCLELTSGIEVVGNFTNVNFNHGYNFDRSNGKFTAPVYGFYIISLSVRDEESNPFRFICYKHVKDGHDTEFDVERVCVVTDERLVTCFTDLKTGDFLYLEADEVDHQTSITINFSCCMLQEILDDL